MLQSSPTYGKMRKPKECGVPWVFYPHKTKRVFRMALFNVTHGIRVDKKFVAETFGRLTALGPKFRMGRDTYQVFLCDCGERIVVRHTNVTKGRTTSCGCLRKDHVKRRNTTHAKSQTPEYAAWYSMLQRCYNPASDSYRRYGGRGIGVCSRWFDGTIGGFWRFLADLGERPEGTSLERKRVHGDYSPENCCWATDKQQRNNKENTIYICYHGVVKPLVYWLDFCDVPASTLRNRITSGWSHERALTQPVRQTKGNSECR